MVATNQSVTKTRRLIVKKLVLAVTVLTLCALSSAQSPSATEVETQQEALARSNKLNTVAAASHSPFSTTACSFTFTSGADGTFLKYCVTANGNIVQFEAPSGHPLISPIS